MSGPLGEGAGHESESPTTQAGFVAFLQVARELLIVSRGRFAVAVLARPATGHPLVVVVAP